MSNTTRAPSTRKTVPGMGRIFRRGQTFWIAYYRTERSIERARIR